MAETDLDSRYFEEFIDTETDDTIKSLCKEFSDECPEINADNFKQKIAERFKQIIRNVATTKHKRKQKSFSCLSHKKRRWLQQCSLQLKNNTEHCWWRKNTASVQMMAVAHLSL